MRKNYLCFVRIETELMEKLKKRAQKEEISLSEFIRRLMKRPSSLEKMQNMLEEIHGKLVRK